MPSSRHALFLLRLRRAQRLQSKQPACAEVDVQRTYSPLAVVLSANAPSLKLMCFLDLFVLLLLSVCSRKSVYPYLGEDPAQAIPLDCPLHPALDMFKDQVRSNPNVCSQTLIEATKFASGLHLCLETIFSRWGGCHFLCPERSGVYSRVRVLVSRCRSGPILDEGAVVPSAGLERRYLSAAVYPLPPLSYPNTPALLFLADISIQNSLLVYSKDDIRF